MLIKRCHSEIQRSLPIQSSITSYYGVITSAYGVMKAALVEVLQQNNTQQNNADLMNNAHCPAKFIPSGRA